MKKNKESLQQQATDILKKIERNRAGRFSTENLERALEQIKTMAKAKDIKLKLYA